MSELKDTLALSILAYRKGMYEESAKLYSAAMGMDDLDTFLSEITRNAPMSKLIMDVPTTENTMAPSLCSSEDLLLDLVEKISNSMDSMSSVYLDRGEYEEESRASYDDEENGTISDGVYTVASTNKIAVEIQVKPPVRFVKSIGPVVYRG